MLPLAIGFRYQARVITALRHARLAGAGPLDGNDGDRVADVVIAGERIVAIVDAGTVVLPDGLGVTRELAGAWLLPGIVDTHVHLTGGGGEAGFATRVPRLMIDTLAKAGVTSVVGVLGTDGVTRTTRDLVATALGLREEGLSAWCYTGSYALPPVTLTGSVKDDIVFVDPIIGVGELALSDHRSSQPTLHELLRIASDAYVAGLTAKKAGLVHIHLGDGARGLELVRQALGVAEIPARVWHPTHLNRNAALFAEAQELARRGPRLPWFDLTAFPDDDLDGALSAADAAAAWVDGGCPRERLTISSDGGGCLPTFDADGVLLRMGVGSSATLLTTVKTLVARHGWRLGDAWALVSEHPARAAMLPRKGRIEVGGDADLVVLDKDLALRAVMARGGWLIDDGQLTERGRGVFGRQESSGR